MTDHHTETFTTPSPAAPAGGTPGAVTGVVPPLVTPLTADGEVDRASLSRQVTRLLEAGVDGIFALGSSGEVAFYDDNTRAVVLDTVVTEVSSQVPVIVGVIDMQTSRVIQHIQAAERFSIAGFVATAPFYAISGPEELDAHFRQIAQAAPAPLWAYDIPVCVHQKLNPAHLVELGNDGVLSGVKDSSGDDVSFRRLAALNQASGNPLTLLTGHEVVVDGAYLSGAHGSVPGLGNVDPDGYVRLHRAAMAKDWETARQEQERLAALFEIVFTPHGKVGPAAGVGAFKTALREMGVFSTNTMSPPMTALDETTSAKIRDILARHGLL